MSYTNKKDFCVTEKNIGNKNRSSAENYLYLKRRREIFRHPQKKIQNNIQNPQKVLLANTNFSVCHFFLTCLKN